MRGRCLYPQDLELMVESMADEFPEIAVSQLAAFALPEGGGLEQEAIGLIVKVTPRKNPGYDPERLVEAIQARALAQFEVGFGEIALVRSGIPKTSSGKKMRTSCAAQLQAGLEHFELEHRWRRGAARRAGGGADTDPGEAAAVELLEAELARLIVEWIAAEEQLDPASISTRQPFSDLGLDSFMAVSLIDFLERQLEISISTAIFDDYRTIDALSRYLALVGRSRGRVAHVRRAVRVGG